LRTAPAPAAISVRVLRRARLRMAILYWSEVRRYGSVATEAGSVKGPCSSAPA